MISISKQASKKSSRKAVCKRKIQARFTAFVMMRSSSSFHAGDTSHSPLSAHTLTHTHTKPPEETDTQRRNLCDSCYTKGRQVVRGESRQVEESPPPSRHRRSIQLRLWRARRTKKGKCPQKLFGLIFLSVCIAFVLRFAVPRHRLVVRDLDLAFG